MTGVVIILPKSYSICILGIVISLGGVGGVNCLILISFTINGCINSTGVVVILYKLSFISKYIFLLFK